MTGSRPANLTTVTASNSGPLTLSGTNTYVLGGVVIDPGPDDEAHLSEVAAASPIEIILLTHRHPDHGSGAPGLSEMTGAPVLAFGDGISDGDEFPGGLVAIHTPGHAPDHVCFFHEASGTLFSGDLIAGEGSIMVAPPEGNLTDYVASLEKARKLSPSRILPGHGPEVEDARAKIEEYISHREEREAMVVSALDSGAKSVEEVVALAYPEVPPEMRPYAGRAARAHLEKLGRSL